MILGVQKRLTAEILGCSKARVFFEHERLGEIKEAITKADLRALIDQGAIRKRPARGSSRARINFAKGQRRKGRRKGHGSRKGAAAAGMPKKKVWVNKVRLQRTFLKSLRAEKIIVNPEFAEIYKKIKGGFFRSKRHLELYLTERGILKVGKQVPAAEKVIGGNK